MNDLIYEIQALRHKIELLDKAYDMIDETNNDYDLSDILDKIDKKINMYMKELNIREKKCIKQ